MEYRNFDECLAYIEELMIKDGPFDGLMGFSQGAILSAALPGLQERVSSRLILDTTLRTEQAKLCC
jgi:hypothetical protein